MKTIPYLYLFLCPWILIAGPEATEPEAAAEPPAELKPLEAHDWVILKHTPQTKTNNRKAFKSYLPSFIDSNRASGGIQLMSTPMPHGAIRFFGGEQPAMEVLLSLKDGRFLGHWPPSKKRSGKLKWLDLSLAASGNLLRQIPETHWLAPLRTRGLIASEGGQMDQFLYYDFEMEYEAPLSFVTKADKPIEMVLADKVSLGRLALYKPNEDGWQQQLFETFPLEPAEGTNVVRKTTLDGFEAAQKKDDVIQEWRDHLSGQGFFPEEVELMVDTLEVHAFHDERMTMVYQLSQEEMERWFPLEIYPLPQKSIRAGLVILQDMDPGIGTEVEELIVQLGDADWDKREAAFKRLRTLGPQAEAKLNEGLKSKDLEVIHRCERLIHLLKNPVAGEEELGFDFRK